MKDVLLLEAARMSAGPPATDLARYARREYGSPDARWLTSPAPAREPVRDGGPKGLRRRARALFGRIAAFLRGPSPADRPPAVPPLPSAHRGAAEDAMGAAVFLTTPRRRTVDTSELARYSRYEFGTESLSWMVPEPPVDPHDHEEALARWLRGEDAALEAWLSEPDPELARTPERIRRPVATTATT